jgi:hypothetical protein
MLELLRGRTIAPLMAELNVLQARTLWSRAGSWAGAMILAGLEPLTRKTRKIAIKQYALRNVTPYLIPKPLREKIPPEAFGQLLAVCDQIHKDRRLPHMSTIPKECVAQLQGAGFSILDLFRQMGVHILGTRSNQDTIR